MGFYYGSNTPPPEDKQGGIREAMMMTWAVFRVLALPLGIILGGMAALLLVIFLFTIHPLAGVAAIVAVLAVIGARAAWELRHPPTLKE